MRKGRILLVEDEPNLRRVLSYQLEKHGHSVIQASDGADALARLREGPVDVVLTDVRMPGMDGMELLDALRGRRPGLPVVVMTAYGTIADAVEAMKRGAADYLTKPVDQRALLLVVEKALRLADLSSENRRLKSALVTKKPLEAAVAASRAMREVLEAVERVAPTEATVLITGESGTGKELVARALHGLSGRAGGPFVAVNCAALPRDLLESELFGHEKGSFTGAVESRPGRFAQAHGGTLFLDEVGDMDPSLQSKILRALQERVVDPLGGREPRSVDVRILAASNRDLGAAVEDGSFRRDLYYRLNVIPIHIPPLRERPEDIRVLVAHFLREYGQADAEVTPEAWEILTAHSWPGNVRELQNVCQRIAILSRGLPVTPGLLPSDLLPGEKHEVGRGEGLWDLEREAILRALRENGGNRSAAARALRIPRHVLLYRIKKFGLPT